MRIDWSCLTIEVDILAGTDISEACSEMIALAERIKIPVASKFNDVRLYAVPGGTAETLERNWRAAIASKRPYKHAHSVNRISDEGGG